MLKINMLIGTRTAASPIQSVPISDRYLGRSIDPQTVRKSHYGKLADPDGRPRPLVYGAELEWTRPITVFLREVPVGMRPTPKGR